MLREVAEYPNTFGPLGKADERIDESMGDLFFTSTAPLFRTELLLSREEENELFAGGIGVALYAPPSGMTSLNAAAIAPAGGNLPHNNMQPYLTVNFCIALQGIFPPRS